jgi:hypothetical protein
MELKNHKVFVNSAISTNKRAKIVKWMINALKGQRLSNEETLYLALSYLDRYLTVLDKSIKKNFQNIAMACILIASKTEDVFPI